MISKDSYPRSDSLEAQSTWGFRYMRFIGEGEKGLSGEGREGSRTGQGRVSTGVQPQPDAQGTLKKE